MVPIGYLVTTSAAKAASILMAKSPRQMLLRGENHFAFRQGMQIPITIPRRAVREALRHNLHLVVAAVGYAVVPVLVYHERTDGRATFVVGRPGLRASGNEPRAGGLLYGEALVTGSAGR